MTIRRKAYCPHLSLSLSLYGNALFDYAISSGIIGLVGRLIDMQNTKIRNWEGEIKSI